MAFFPAALAIRGQPIFDEAVAGYHFRFSQPAMKSPAEMRRLFPFPGDNPPQCVKVRIGKLRLYIQRIIITSLAIGLLFVWREQRPKLIFAAGVVFLCVGKALLALFIQFATHA